jgi:hypothetical protein
LSRDRNFILIFVQACETCAPGGKNSGGRQARRHLYKTKWYRTNIAGAPEFQIDGYRIVGINENTRREWIRLYEGCYGDLLVPLRNFGK